MNSVFAERFKSARLLSGLSLQDVADRLSKSVTRQAIYRYEKGEVIPDSETIAELSNLFNVRTDFFFRTTTVEIGAVEYRKLKIPAKEETRIKEQTKDYLSRYLELEDILGIKVDFVNPLKDYPAVTEYANVNQAANILRDKWGLGSSAISNIAELLEDKNIKVLKIKADGRFDGLQTYANRKIPVIAYNINELDNKKDRIRFTLLHELAHLLLRFNESITHNQKEKLCHQFAGAMLFPDSAIKQELGEFRHRLSINELGNIKKQYGISMQAIVMRANICKIVNDNYKRQFFNMMEDNGWRIDEPVNYEGNEESGRFDQLIFRALAEELISISKAAALKNMSVAELKKQMI
ncbi:MAG: ImmA/IrrE family metallo-endopeptidase [Flavobacteriales bacterium]|nr:ImmA/IrrE family metallo-endopeptidase [Flavobacteriales bacterium]MCB9198741.1 ImmA/IrrE family metallo-endopeptidase [Flavobacteriales bacterium]